MRVADHLTEHRLAFDNIVHAPVFSAQKRAKMLRVPGRQVAKGVLLAGPQGLFLAVLPASHHIDMTALAAALRGPVRMAEVTEMTELFSDCEWGAVPPFGSLYGIPTVIDLALDLNAELVFQGHTHSEAFRLRGRDFERLERPLRLRFARPGPCALHVLA